MQPGRLSGVSRREALTWSAGTISSKIEIASNGHGC
jgi:hypothetical protein